VAGAVHSGVPKVAVTSSVLALSMVGAAVRAFLSGALGTSPSLEAVASAVVALSIVVTVSRAGTDGTVSTDPSGWTQTLAIQTASTERAIVQANLIQPNDGTVFTRMTREAHTGSIMTRSLPVTIARALPRR